MVATVPTEKCPELSVLGTFRFGAREGELPISGGPERLLAFLGLSDRAVMLSSAAKTLWPDATDEHASARLQSALARVKQADREAVVVTSIDLRLAEHVVVDIRESRALAYRLLDLSTDLTEADSSADALATLSVDLLPDWYDDWVLVQAEEWRQLRLHALETLAERTLTDRRFAIATGAALAVVRAEPLRESARATVIRVHLAEGNQSEALAEYGRFTTLLHAELGLEPTANLRGLVADLAPATTDHADHADDGAQRAFKSFDATPDTCNEARQFVRDAIERFGDTAPVCTDLVEVASLLASELVSDALAHRAAAVHVLVLGHENRLRVEVFDTRRSSNVSVGEAPATYEIRMRLLNDLADRWSMEYVGTGQLNWFELRPRPSRTRSIAEHPARASGARSTPPHVSRADRARNWLRHTSRNN